MDRVGQRGMSILGTLTAMGAATTLMAGLSSVITIASKNSRGIENQHHFEEIRSVMRHITSDTELCSETPTISPKSAAIPPRLGKMDWLGASNAS